MGLPFYENCIIFFSGPQVRNRFCLGIIPICFFCVAVKAERSRESLELDKNQHAESYSYCCNVTSQGPCQTTVAVIKLSLPNRRASQKSFFNKVNFCRLMLCPLWFFVVCEPFIKKIRRNK